MFVVLNAKLIAPTAPATSVTGPERQFAFSVLAAGEEGFALIFLIGCYFLVFSLYELISVLKGEDTQPQNN